MMGEWLTYSDEHLSREILRSKHVGEPSNSRNSAASIASSALDQAAPPPMQASSHEARTRGAKRRRQSAETAGDDDEDAQNKRNRTAGIQPAVTKHSNSKALHSRATVDSKETVGPGSTRCFPRAAKKMRRQTGRDDELHPDSPPVGRSTRLDKRRQNEIQSNSHADSGQSQV